MNQTFKRTPLLILRAKLWARNTKITKGALPLSDLRVIWLWNNGYNCAPWPANQPKDFEVALILTDLTSDFHTMMKILNWYCKRHPTDYMNINKLYMRLKKCGLS